MGFENTPSSEDLGISQKQKNNKPKKISRRDLLKLLAIGAGSLVLSIYGVKPPKENTTQQVEKEQNPELLRLLNGLDSVFHVFPTTGIPERLHVTGDIESRIYKDDDVMRTNLQRKLSELSVNETGVDMIIQSLGYPHIVHNNTYLLAERFDIYNNFDPNRTGNESDARVLEVMKHDIEEVERSKKELQAKGVDELRGFAINYDEHSSDYLSSDAVDETFPDIETIEQLGITRLIFVGEFSPQVEGSIAGQIADNSYAPRDHLIDFVQNCQRNGIEIIVWGIDTRHDIVNDNSDSGLTERRCDVNKIVLDNGSTVIFGGCSPNSNPRIKLQDETLMRIVGGEVQVILPDNPLGRNATPDETNLYYQLVNEANSQQ